MITNLLRNAIQHTAAGGTVAVRTQAGEARVWISVQDSGRGLSREALALLFKDSAGAPTPPPAHSEGMGVGLAVVRKLARMQGGSVSAHSPGLEQGSTFTLELQRAPLPPAPVEPLAPPPAPSDSARRVLLIDDNANLRLSMRLLLEHSGFRVQEAADGRAGLERLAGGDFDAAVVDLRMPELNGMELARRIRATPHGARLRLVALTGMAGTEEQAAALQAGFDQVMIKPANPDQLAAALA
ncbi:MAG: response regulator [Myxococcota bacterium]|nr:response regulator [Myxococcota bacterium]